MFVTKRTQQLLLTHHCFSIFYDCLYLHQQDKLHKMGAKMVGKAIRLQSFLAALEENQTVHMY